MNLYLRLLLTILAASKKEWIPLDMLHNRLSLRVWPNDLDINRHMNNGRYMTICDLSRIDFFVRTGLLGLMLRNRWMPVIREHTMTYIKPLHLLQRYDVEMRVARWDEKYFYSTHHFTSQGKAIAEGTSIAGVRNREGVINPEQVLKAVETYQQQKRRR